jgi:hypothetical protein
VKWLTTYNSKKNILNFSAKIDADWHLYATYVPEPNEGPLPTLFSFTESKRYNLIDSIIQRDPITQYDKNFGINLAYYENSAVFSQNIKPLKNKFKIEGNIKYMTCNDSRCIPGEHSFKVKVKSLN